MKQFCPICKSEVSPFARYPRYICQGCVRQLSDQEGRSVYYVNTTPLGGGCQGHYRDDRSLYNHMICYVGKVRCCAQEARFGGIVVQVSHATEPEKD